MGSESKMAIVKVPRSMLASVIRCAEAIGADVIPIESSSDGWGMTIADTAHIAMLKIFISMHRFQEFQCPEEFRFAVKTAKLRSTLKMIPDESLSIEVNEWGCSIAGARVRCNVSNVAMYSAEKLRFPKIDLPVAVVLDTKELIPVVSASLSDVITIGCSPEGLKVIMKADGLEHDDITFHDSEVVSDVSAESQYPAPYVVNALKALPSTVLLSMSSDYPMTLSATEPFDITYLLAPRIEED